MAVSRFCSRLRLPALAVLVLAFGTRSNAGMLLPDPAKGKSPAVDPFKGNRVVLMPNPALYRSTDLGCPWLLPAAETANQPYNKDKWNFSYAAKFNGTFTLETYEANIVGVLGWADFKITYKPGDGDPSGLDVRWMQVIDTNMPTKRGSKYGVTNKDNSAIPAGTTAYLDNEGPKDGNPKPDTGYVPVDPYYGWLSVPKGNAGMITDSTMATATSFADFPIQPFKVGYTWEAQVFLAKQTDEVIDGATIHNVKIYGGVWWGFQDLAPAPEPSTWVLATIALGIGVLFRRQRSRNHCQPEKGTVQII
jgi:hypothetical protein